MRRGTYIAALFAALGLQIWPGSALASGFAPDEGVLWLKLAYGRWTAEERFAGPFDRNTGQGIEIGDRIPFEVATGGELLIETLSLTAVFSPLERLVVGIYAPVYQRAEFENLNLISTTEGTGDLRPWIGYQITPDGLDLATTVNAHLKIPVTELPRELESIPLGEGQYDVAVEAVTTWAALPRLHLSGRTLFRRRFEFDDGDRVIKPGDEFELGLDLGGGPTSWLWIRGGWSSLWSTGLEDRSGQGAVTLRERRQVHELFASAYVGLGGLVWKGLDGFALDVGAALPVAGQDYPAGPSWAAGLAWSRELY